MKQEIQKTDTQSLALKQQVPASSRHLLNSIAKGDHLQVQVNAGQYIERGAVDFAKVQHLPLSARIPNLTHVYGLEAVHKLLTVLLTHFCNSLNLIRPMSEPQIIECAYELMMTSEEDQLSVEDYVLFFKGATGGDYGRILDRMDKQTLFTLLEEYRQRRWDALRKAREEAAALHKSQGPTERVNERNELAESMGNLVGKLGMMKEKLKEQREINKANRL